jgi:DNA-directed RNA polymerase specialized sigma24 family protein
MADPTRVDRSFIAERNRLLLRLAEHGHTYEQIAHATGLARNTIKRALYNARTRPEINLEHLTT